MRFSAGLRPTVIVNLVGVLRPLPLSMCSLSLSLTSSTAGSPPRLVIEPPARSVRIILTLSLSLQHLRREFQSATQWLTQHTKKLFLQSSLLQRPGERGAYSVGGEQGSQPPNVLLHCLELLLPVNDHFLLQEDRELVDKYRKLLGKVSVQL